MDCDDQYIIYCGRGSSRMGIVYVVFNWDLCITLLKFGIYIYPTLTKMLGKRKKIYYQFQNWCNLSLE